MQNHFLKFISAIIGLIFITPTVLTAYTITYTTEYPQLKSWQIIDEGTNYAPSSWSSTGGIIYQTSNIYGGSTGMEPEKPGTFAIAGNSDWADYVFQVSLSSMDDDGIGVVFRYQDTQNYYRFSMDKERRFARLVKNVDGHMSILAEREFIYTKDEWYLLHITIVDDKIELKLNNDLLFTIRDSALHRGKVGLYCWGNTSSSFKDITISPIKTISDASTGSNGEIVVPTTMPQPLAAAPSSKDTPPSYTSSDLKRLNEQLNLLQKEVKALREEAEIRRQLQMTADEKAEEEEELLSAAGREYTLLKQGTLGLEYSFSYSYYSLDSLSQAASVAKYSNHNTIHSLFIEYALKDNLTLNMDIPFAFKHYDDDGESKWVNDLGDVRFGLQYQPIKTGADLPSIIFTSSLSCPTGRSPYEIEPLTSLATGDGTYSLSAGLSASKTIDPIIAFGNIGYTYIFTESGLTYHPLSGGTINKVDPGDYINASVGFAYALSYKVSLNISYQYTYGMETTYYYDGNQPKGESSASVSSLLSIGLGWRISQKRTVITTISSGYTNDDPDFMISVRLPFEFNLK